MVVSMSNIYCISLQTGRTAEIFDLPATTLSIPSLSHSFAVVTFAPETMQLYSAVFDASLEVASRYEFMTVCSTLVFSMLFVCPFISTSVVRE